MHSSAEHDSATSGSIPVLGTGESRRIAYRVRDAADQIGVSEREMWRLVKTGEVASFKYGEYRTSPRRITHEALVAFVQRMAAATKTASAA